MPTASETTLKLDPVTTERVQRLAVARHRSSDEILREAVEEYVSRAEKREEFRQAALAVAEHYDMTGLHLTQEEMEEWMLKVEAGEDAPMPECHV
jgi:predicted transcriptional regulator